MKMVCPSGLTFARFWLFAEHAVNCFSERAVRFRRCWGWRDLGFQIEHERFQPFEARLQFGDGNFQFADFLA